MKKRKTDCPITFALDFYGDRWSLLILRDVLFMGKRGYKEFLESKEKISTNILASRLEKLEENDFLVKERDSKNKKKFIYSPTPKALDLMPVLLEFVRWSAKYDEETPVTKKFLQKLKNDREGLIKEMTAHLKKSD